MFSMKLLQVIVSILLVKNHWKKRKTNQYAFPIQASELFSGAGSVVRGTTALFILAPFAIPFLVTLPDGGETFPFVASGKYYYY